MKKFLIEKIQNADMVFVSIGAEMQVSINDLKENPLFSEKLTILENSKDKKWIIPYLIKIFLNRINTSDIRNAYAALLRLIKDKNYYIVSLSTDDIIYDFDFYADRVVLPCGGYQALQCEDNCQNELYQIDHNLLLNIQDWISNKKDIGEIKEPVCPHCGKPLVFNQYGQLNYNEEGYLRQWNKYKLWLQGTMNRNLCILELGDGMEFPSVVRWPMEKVCFYNKKSSLFRVHSKLYQLSKDIEERGYSIKSDPISFLIQEN